MHFLWNDNFRATIRAKYMQSLFKKVCKDVNGIIAVSDDLFQIV